MVEDTDTLDEDDELVLDVLALLLDVLDVLVLLEDVFEVLAAFVLVVLLAEELLDVLEADASAFVEVLEEFPVVFDGSDVALLSLVDPSVFAPVFPAEVLDV